MAVKRIVATIEPGAVDAARPFTATSSASTC